MLSTYTNISAAVANWLIRPGAAHIENNVEDFIILAQRRIQREVRVPPMEVLDTNITITNGQSVINSSMLDVKEVVATDGSVAWDVNRGSYTDVLHRRASGRPGPRVFDTVAGNFEFGPEPSSGVTVDVVYYQELEYISTTVDSNWFSQYAPESILYGALAEAASFTKDTEMMTIYEGKYKTAIDAIKTQKQKAEFSGRLEIRKRQ